MTRNIQVRPERLAEWQRLAVIASKCHTISQMLHGAEQAPDIGGILTGTEYLVIAQLLERVVLDGDNVAAEYWESIPHRPQTTASRNLYIAIDAELRRTKGDRKIWQAIADDWGMTGVNAAEDAKKLARPYREDAKLSVNRHSERGAKSLDDLARNVSHMRQLLRLPIARRKGGR